MGEIVSENMTKNANAKVLSKEEIMAALNERHSPEKQKHLSAGRAGGGGRPGGGRGPGGGGLDQMWRMHLQELVSGICT